MKEQENNISKMLDFSKPKPGFNYLTGWKDTPVINTKGEFLEEKEIESPVIILKLDIYGD